MLQIIHLSNAIRTAGERNEVIRYCFSYNMVHFLQLCLQMLQFEESIKFALSSSPLDHLAMAALLLDASPSCSFRDLIS